MFTIRIAGFSIRFHQITNNERLFRNRFVFWKRQWLCGAFHRNSIAGLSGNLIDRLLIAGCLDGKLWSRDHPAVVEFQSVFKILVGF